jgi:threonylcarbamoyladenosine tRNA methylthiotransferase MtaB
MKKFFKIVTLGCRANQYESAVYKEQMERFGGIFTNIDEKADFFILNSCYVTEKASKTSLNVLKKFLSKNKKAKVFVTGCFLLSEKVLHLKKNKRIFFIPNEKKENIVRDIFNDKNLKFQLTKFPSHTRAFVKIQDGCNNFCSYCVIPFSRGRSRSRKIEDILFEVKNLVKNGYKEIVLTGINIGDFRDGNKRLKDLVKEMDEIKDLKRIRLSSIAPDQIDEELKKTILNGNKTMPSMHIVLQSGSNRILKLMGRGYTKEIFLEKINSFKENNKDFTITTDIIVGFPGEEDEDFEESLNIVKRENFLKVHIFPFSKRKNTKAYNFKKIPSKIIFERKNILLEEAANKAFELRQKYVGKRKKILVEDKKKLHFFGHSNNFLLVKLLGKSFIKNEFFDVLLCGNKKEYLEGKVLDEDRD